jgi:hypothetical protein
VQGVVRTHPDDIEHETIRFARIRAGTPAQHLLVQRRTLGRPRHNNAVDRGLVKAFGEHGTIGDHACGARVQPVEDGPAGGERGGAIEGLRSNAGGTKGLGHRIGQGHRGGKEQGSAIQVMLASERRLRNTLNINVVYMRKLGQSITYLSLPLRKLGIATRPGLTKGEAAELLAAVLGDWD